MTNLQVTSEPSKDIGSEQHSTGVDTSQPQLQLLRHQAFACWQIAVVTIFTGILGASSLIAINLCLMGHPALAIMVSIPAISMSWPYFLSGPSPKTGPNAVLASALLAYLFARYLFRWQYAPFRKPFARLSTLPNRLAPLWYAFVCAIGSWMMLYVGLLALALCVDVGAPLSPNPTPVEDLPILKAPALEETEAETIESDETEFDRKFPK